MIVIVSLVSPDALTRGLMRNLFLEPQANLFVGQLNSKQVRQVLDLLMERECSGVLVVQSKKDPLGVRLKQLAPADRRIVVIDGIQLVEKPYKSYR